MKILVWSLTETILINNAGFEYAEYQTNPAQDSWTLTVCLRPLQTELSSSLLCSPRNEAKFGTKSCQGLALTLLHPFNMDQNPWNSFMLLLPPISLKTPCLAAACKIFPGAFLPGFSQTQHSRRAKPTEEEPACSERSLWQRDFEKPGMAWVPPGGQGTTCDSHRCPNVHLGGHGSSRTIQGAQVRGSNEGGEVNPLSALKISLD